jgi:hypothetical protein
MTVDSTSYPSSSSSTSLSAGPPADKTNDQLQAAWQAIEQQAHALPSGQRKHSEDAALMQLYRSGGISAQDLDSLLTKAADKNPQVDPGKEAVARLAAAGLKLTGQQKDAIEKSARNQAAQAKVADAERLLDTERSALGQGSTQALSIGVTTFDANGNQRHLLVRNTGPGANSIQQIHDLGDGYRDQVLIDAAEDQLEAEMAATPPDRRKTLSEKVHAPGGTYDVTLDTNGKLSVTKETGFWGSILHGLEAIAPIALAAIPGVGPIAASAYLGATGGYEIANGNVAAGLEDIAGGMAGVGGFGGGGMGSGIQDAATVTQYGDQAYAAATTGNVAGLLNAADGLIGDAAGSAIQDAATLAQYADMAYGAVNSGNVAGVLNAAGGFIGGATVSAIQDAATPARHGDQAHGAIKSGNVNEGNVNEAVRVATLVHEILTATSVEQAGQALSAVAELRNHTS